METQKASVENANVWILVDHSSREAAFDAVNDTLQPSGINTEIVTITEVISSAARDAITGGAERLLRGLRVAYKGRSSDEDFIGAVRKAGPDLLVITNPRYGRALGLLESLTGLATLQMGVLPDYNFSGQWQKSHLQAFVVPHEEMKDRLIRGGFPSERVLIAGPPIQKSFARELDRAAEREKLHFADEKVVLVRADTFETALLERLVFQATTVENTRFVFHHNSDQGAAVALRRAAAQYGLQAAMFGKVDDLERFVLAADLIIAHPAEPRIADIVAQDRPVLFVGPEAEFGEQIQFLARHKAARYSSDVLRLGAELERLLEDETLDEMVEAARGLSELRGSQDVAEAIKTALEYRHEWKSVPVDVDPPDDDAPADPEVGDDSPFESIGRSKPVASTGGGKDDSAQTTRYEGISQAEAKDQLAALILQERDIERQLAETEKQQQHWRNRLELAREWKEEDLAQEAEKILRGHLSDAERLGEELRSITRQKEKLKLAAQSHRPQGGQPDGRQNGDEPQLSRDAEERFRRMEVDSDLQRLRDRIKRELGE